MFKVNNEAWHRSGVFIVNFEHVLHIVLVFLLLTLSMQLSAGWVIKPENTLVCSFYVHDNDSLVEKKPEKSIKERNIF